MTDRILSMPVYGAVTCTQLPGREIGLARREMMNASGGMIPLGPYFVIRLVAEILSGYLDNGD